MLASFGIRHSIAPLVAFGMLPLACWAGYMFWEHSHGADLLDSEGVTRRDGRRFLWANLRDVQRVHVIHKWGQQGALNHLVVRFAEGQVRVFPVTLDNGREVIDFIERISAPEPAEPPPSPEPPPRPKIETCGICSQLSTFHRGFQKHGREEDDTFLPPACAHLVGVRDLTRRRSVVKCPECGTHYLHEIEYKFLATGSEDEQRLTRLSDEEASALLEKPGGDA